MPPAHFTLGFNINYPYTCQSDPRNQFDFRPFKTAIPDGPGKNDKLKTFEDSFKTIAQQYIAHFAEKGWTRTRFEIYYNQKPNDPKRGPRNCSPWKLDEPTDEPDYKGLGYLFQLERWAFAGAAEKKVQIVNRIDIGHWHCDKFQTKDGQPNKCYKAKGYDRDNADTYFKGVVDHWVIGTTHGHAAQQLLKDYEAPGVKLMLYGTTGSDDIVRPYINFRKFGFLQARMGLVGQIMFKLGLATADPSNQEETSYKDNCMYNGKCLGFDGALPSHRLKLWRNAVNDFEYVELARKKDKAAVEAILIKMTFADRSSDKEYRKAGTREFFFTNNVEDLIAARAGLVEIITGQKFPGFEVKGPSKEYVDGESADQIVNYD